MGKKDLEKNEDDIDDIDKKDEKCLNAINKYISNHYLFLLNIIKYYFISIEINTKIIFKVY